MTGGPLLVARMCLKAALRRACSYTFPGHVRPGKVQSSLEDRKAEEHSLRTAATAGDARPYKGLGRKVPAQGLGLIFETVLKIWAGFFEVRFDLPRAL